MSISGVHRITRLVQEIISMQKDNTGVSLRVCWGGLWHLGLCSCLEGAHFLVLRRSGLLFGVPPFKRVRLGRRVVGSWDQPASRVIWNQQAYATPGGQCMFFGLAVLDCYISWTYLHPLRLNRFQKTGLSCGCLCPSPIRLATRSVANYFSGKQGLSMTDEPCSAKTHQCGGPCVPLNTWTALKKVFSNTAVLPASSKIDADFWQDLRLSRAENCLPPLPEAWLCHMVQLGIYYDIACSSLRQISGKLQASFCSGFDRHGRSRRRSIALE